MTYTTPHVLINPGDDYTDKHIVINCRTNTISACETFEQAQSLAAEHDSETTSILLEQSNFKSLGNKLESLL